MTTELALNAYVLLGNALHYLVDQRIDAESELSAASIAHLYARIEPLRPDQILAVVDALSPEDRSLLRKACGYVLATLNDDEVITQAGLPRDVAEQVLSTLSLT